MNHILLSSLLILGFTFSSQAEDWTFLPNDYDTMSNPHYGVAFVAGSADLDKDDSSGDLFGVELSFVCPLVQASEHTIRQQVSLTKFHKSEVDIYAIEANPHYLYQIESNTYIGIGPSFGLATVNGTDDDFAMTLGAGASLRKDITNELFLGAEFRTVYATERDIDNVRVALKVGYYFDM